MNAPPLRSMPAASTVPSPREPVGSELLACWTPWVCACGAHGRVPTVDDAARELVTHRNIAHGGRLLVNELLTAMGAGV